MPLTTPTSIPNSISPTGISGGIENLSQNNVSSFKDENMPSVTSPGSPNATYATNLSSTHNHMVPILGKKLDKHVPVVLYKILGYVFELE